METRYIVGVLVFVALLIGSCFGCFLLGPAALARWQDVLSIPGGVVSVEMTPVVIEREVSVTVEVEKEVVVEKELVVEKEAPVEVVKEAVVTPTPQPATTAACRVIHDYGLHEDMDHLSTSGSYIHVEYWWEGEPEREALLPTAGVSGGRYNLTRGLRGHVWEYADCTSEEVMAQIEAHIARRLAGEANNAGYVNWQDTGLFEPVW